MSDFLERQSLDRKFTTKKIATAAIFIGIGLILSYLNPFAYFLIFNTKINPFVHMINAITGVLIGLLFSTITATGIAIFRPILNIGTIHAFHGGIPGAIVVGIVAFLIKKKNPKYINYAAFFEPLGTILIGGSIAWIIELGGLNPEGIFYYWGLFAGSCVPGSIIGFIILGILKNGGITWEDFN
ncbi:MAG: energy coupling factor transporter S component ThiW [Promethearchaeota archaeon]